MGWQESLILLQNSSRRRFPMGGEDKDGKTDGRKQGQGIIRFVPPIGALVFGAFHVLTIVTTLFATHGHGEGQAFAVLFLDFPLVLLLQAVPGGGYILYQSVTAYVWFFSSVGTLMYLIVGYGLGVLLRILVTRIIGGRNSSAA
jgi:hypothetical protein